MSTPATEDHVSIALGHIVEQFQDKPVYAGLVAALVGPMQDLELALLQLYTLRWIDTATGAALQVLARIVGQPPLALTDDDFRVYVKARIAVNRSSGTINDLLTIARILLGSAYTLRFENQGPASGTMHIEGAQMSAILEATLPGFLQRAAKGGVRILTHALESTEAASFALGMMAQVTTLASIGSTFIRANTAGYPGSGTLVIGAGLASQETVVYDTVSGTGVTRQFNLHVVTTKAHAVGDACVLSDSYGGTLDDGHLVAGSGTFTSIY